MRRAVVGEGFVAKIPGEDARIRRVRPEERLRESTWLVFTLDPAQLWQELRTEPGLVELDDNDLWDSIAFIWQENTYAEDLAEGQRLYEVNCAACHGETGKGDGVMVTHLPAAEHNENGQHGLVRPPDFTDPQILLSASPALLEGKMIRGGMGTGMPYWGPIFTDGQNKAIISFLYTFVLQAQFVVINIVRRRYFQTAGTKFHRYIFIKNNRHFTIYQGNNYCFAVQINVSFIIWIDTDCSIT